MAIECRQCGRSNPDGAQFCADPACGAYLDWATETTPTPASTATPEAGQAGASAQQRAGRSPEQHAAAALSLADRSLAVDPAVSIEVAVTVHNGGSTVEEFVVTVAGPSSRWATVEPAALTVYPGEDAVATVRFVPPAGPEAPAGRMPFTVRAASTVHRGLVVAGDGVLEIGVFRAVTAALVPEQTSGRGRTVHRVEVTNAGNIVERVQVQAKDQEGRLSFDAPRGDLPAVPGRSMTMLIGVRPRFRLVGRPRWHPFQVVVIAHPPVSPVRLDGGRRAQALVPRWLAALIVLLMLLLCLGLCSSGVFQ